MNLHSLCTGSALFLMACSAPDTALEDDTDASGSDTGRTGPEATSCLTTFTHQAMGNPDSVRLAGPFNDWAGTEMSGQADGSWTVDLELSPGAHPYKFVENNAGNDAWTCDPEADLIQCDEGYKEVGDTTWDHTCGLDLFSCNSMVRVADCHVPSLQIIELDIDRASGILSTRIQAKLAASDAELVETRASLDGESIEGVWNGADYELILTELQPGRHTLRMDVMDADGFRSESVHVPFWIDSREWEGGLMYYAFTDRVADGDLDLNTSEGGTHTLGSYMGGDYAGLVGLLPYLDDLGVNVIWIANPQDNAEGAYEADCGDYSGYHGYWPDQAREAEEHFGGADGLHALVEAAHDRGMRVVMDWVVNHVHENHPYVTDYEADGWFNDLVTCKVGEDYSNFDLIPETCWFAEYLPDIRFYEPAPLDQMVEDALWWVKTFDLDGFRVDGAKHVPHSVPYNLAARLRQEIEHTESGGDEDFYTVGETFSFSTDWISLYVDENQLDAQFDFPLYGSLRAALLDESISMPELYAARATSDAIYGEAVMSQFLGNHDVSRFVSQADAGSWADSEDSACETGWVPTDPEIYDRLRLAWTFLLTQPGLPLIYYGDELGIPGYRDPSNRAPLWWYSSAIDGSEANLDDVLEGLEHPDEHGPVLQHVAALGQARASHPVLYRGTSVEWWEETDVYSFSRTEGEEHLLVVLNRGGDERTLTNGLSFAGLPTEGVWTDLLTGEVFEASEDSLSLSIPGRSSRVLLWAEAT
jgi:neopullulanase